MTSVSSITIGSTITFRSKDPTDTVVWKGTLETSSASYRAVRGFSNPAQTNERVRQVDPTVPSDYTTLSYFLITVENNASIPTTVAFAEDWIVAGSLQVLTPGTQVKILVDDPANNSQAILSLLASAKYVAKIIS